MELLYVWIEDNPIENLEQDFCFTSEFDIHFDKYEDEIIIKKTDNLNIFKKII